MNINEAYIHTRHINNILQQQNG